MGKWKNIELLKEKVLNNMNIEQMSKDLNKIGFTLQAQFEQHQKQKNKNDDDAMEQKDADAQNQEENEMKNQETEDLILKFVELDIEKNADTKTKEEQI